MQYLEVIFLVLGIIALAAGIGFMALKFLERQATLNPQPVATKSVLDEALQATLKNLNVQLASLQEKNNITEAQLANMQKQTPERNTSIHTTTLHTAEFVPYQYALQLLQEGADLNALRKQFNLSRGELDVLQALHIKDTHLRHIDTQVL